MSSDGPSLSTSPATSKLLFRPLPFVLRPSREEKVTLRKFARLLTQTVFQGSVVCLFTDDRELHKLNHLFLGHDYPTDVLSFPAPESDAGEIAISVERADAQALEYRHSRIDEIRILMLHGFLHLAGMDHEGDDGEMARAEQKWRAEFHLPTTLIERAALTATLL